MESSGNPRAINPPPGRHRIQTGSVAVSCGVRLRPDLPPWSVAQRSRDDTASAGGQCACLLPPCPHRRQGPAVSQLHNQWFFSFLSELKPCLCQDGGPSQLINVLFAGNHWHVLRSVCTHECSLTRPAVPASAAHHLTASQNVRRRLPGYVDCDASRSPSECCMQQGNERAMALIMAARSYLAGCRRGRCEL